MPDRPPLTLAQAQSARRVFEAARRGEPGLESAVMGWQVRLIESGAHLGSSGPRGNGVDGVPGEVTMAALEALTPRPYSGKALDSATRYSLSQHGPAHRLSRNFALGEFQSKDYTSDLVLVHPALVDLLEKIRAHFGRSVHINSAYRTVAHNRAVGGASSSRHLYGLAADITVRGVVPSEVARYARSLDPGGLGEYRSFTHVDVEGRNRRWRG